MVDYPRMLRSFLPVGQGAFCCEQFFFRTEKINVVYDCGTLERKDMEVLERQIRLLFEKGETVHALFVSHFDCDHVNGIEYLLHYCNVKRIYYPGIDDGERTAILLKDLLVNGNGPGTFSFDFAADPERAVRSLPDGVGSEIYLIRVDPQSGANPVSITELRDNETDMDCFENWAFIPYSLPQKKTLREYLEELDPSEISQNLGDAAQTLLDSPDETPDGKRFKDISELYKNYKSDQKITMNATTMTLYSGFTEDSGDRCSLCSERIMLHPMCICHFHRRLYDRCGCLYTGDFDAMKHFEDLRMAYNHYRNLIGCVQIPHHGAKSSYNEAIPAAFTNVSFVICAGFHSRYGHPNASVVNHLYGSGVCPIIVTEKEDSKAVFLIF